MINMNGKTIAGVVSGRGELRLRLRPPPPPLLRDCETGPLKPGAEAAPVWRGPVSGPH